MADSPIGRRANYRGDIQSTAVRDYRELKAEGQFGRTDEEIVRNIFLEFPETGGESRHVAIRTIEDRSFVATCLWKGFARFAR